MTLIRECDYDATVFNLVSFNLGIYGLRFNNMRIDMVKFMEGRGDLSRDHE